MGVKVNEYHLMKGPPIMIQHIHVVLKIFNVVIKISKSVHQQIHYVVRCIYSS